MSSPFPAAFVERATIFGCHPFNQALTINTTSPVPSMLDELGLEPKMVEQYRAFLDSLDRIAAVPQRVLTLCSLRVAAIKGGVDLWFVRNPKHELTDADIEAVLRGSFEAFTADERAALQVTEKLPLAWHELTDAEVAEVSASFGPEGTVALMSAIAYYDVNDRLEATLASLKEEG